MLQQAQIRFFLKKELKKQLAIAVKEMGKASKDIATDKKKIAEVAAISAADAQIRGRPLQMLWKK